MDRDSAALRREIGLGIIAVGVALCVFLLSYANGGFDPTTRAYAGIAAWWILGVAAAIGIGAALTGISRLALWAIGLLAAFAVWTLISVYWAPDAERAFDQFNLVSLYVAVLAIAVLLARRIPAETLIGGTALGLTGVAGVALVSRVFPSTFGFDSGSTIVPPLAHRLSFPLGYWDGLGIEIALAYPLLLALMTSSRSRLVRALAALPLPVLAAVIYLTSSRGALVAVVVAVVAYVVLTPKRWPAAVAVVVAGAAGVAALAILVPRTALVQGRTEVPLGVSQGHQAALWLALACVGTAILWLGVDKLRGRVRTPSRIVGQVTVVTLVLLAVAAIVASHPVAKFDEFKSNSAGASQGTDATTHLLSSSGSGRWQFWGAAVSEFRAHPLVGGGSGSWESWWLQHATLRFFNENAHSLYLETLAELGIIGFLLLGERFSRRPSGRSERYVSRGAPRSPLRPPVGSPSSRRLPTTGSGSSRESASWGWGCSASPWGIFHPTACAPRDASLGRGRAIAVVAVAAIIPFVVVLASGIHLRNSQAAFTAGAAAQARSKSLARAGHPARAHALALVAAASLERARTQALAAKAIEPWAASPRLQLALILEAEENYDAAAQALDEALSRSNRGLEPLVRRRADRDRARQAQTGAARPRRGPAAQSAFDSFQAMISCKSCDFEVPSV